MNIAVDFDGVIHGYSDGWRDGAIYDPPVPGCVEALTELQADGHRIIVFSSRRLLDGVRAWLDEHGVPYDQIASGKPIAHAYVDDRAYRFNGNWLEMKWILRAGDADRSWCSPR